MSEFRVEVDSMGEVNVPIQAIYGAQTQRAVENFPISGLKMKRSVISALGIVKKCAAQSNGMLGLIDPAIQKLIVAAADEVIDGKHDDQFPIDIFQTGSGTSSNMNANEVIAARANALAKEQNLDLKIHPNDHVNFGQSSNDVFPTALRIAVYDCLQKQLIPALTHLQQTLLKKGTEFKDVVKTGKTHLMDAMPVTFEQVFGGYARQILLGTQRIQSSLERLRELPQGGTAVGTGINTHAKFGSLFAQKVQEQTGHPFKEAENHFEAQATVDAPCEVSGQLKTLACSLMKIANDFRWMNSGPNSGVSEIKLAPLQPGSSIMPAKVNPVIEESLCMVCAQVIGCDSTVTIAAQSGNFELNVMFPVVAHNLLMASELLANSITNFADRSVNLVQVNKENIEQQLTRNPILVTALNPLIGYDLAAKIAKRAYAENRPLKEVALEMCDLSEEELDKALDPMKMTRGGFVE